MIKGKVYSEVLDKTGGVEVNLTKRQDRNRGTLGLIYQVVPLCM